MYLWVSADKLCGSVGRFALQTGAPCGNRENAKTWSGVCRLCRTLPDDCCGSGCGLVQFTILFIILLSEFPTDQFFCLLLLLIGCQRVVSFINLEISGYALKSMRLDL